MFSYSFSWRHEKVSRVVWRATAWGAGRHTSFTHIEHRAAEVSREGFAALNSTSQLLNIYFRLRGFLSSLLLNYFPDGRLDVHTTLKHVTKPLPDITPHFRGRYTSIFLTSVPYTTSYCSRDICISKWAGFIIVSAIFHEILQYWGIDFKHSIYYSWTSRQRPLEQKSRKTEGKGRKWPL